MSQMMLVPLGRDSEFPVLGLASSPGLLLTQLMSKLSVVGIRDGRQ